jgi:RND superfamily putative drug exporter
MKKIIRFRWIVLLLWIVVTVVLMLKSPNMESLVREKGQINVPNGYPSSQAAEILSKHKSNDDKSISVITVFHDHTALNSTQQRSIKKTIKRIETKKEELGITKLTTHYEDDSLKDQLVSKDKSTILAMINIDPKNRDIAEVRADLDKELKTNHVDAYMTGNEFINEDVVISSQKGLKKTELITLGFILIVLVLVFRSVVAPIIPLVTVGFTYLVSQTIVGFLVDYWDFPLSNFTQIFLVAILFGIGTDYCILLLSRFKEELAQGQEVVPAILHTYKTAGKTVLFSGLAVLIGFASIGFASFKLYQSAVAVAVGVAVLLVALMTVVPFFMATLKTKLFWPIRGEIAHPESKLWGAAGKLSLSRPFLTLLIVAIITIPFLLTHKGTLSFNSLDEIGNNYASVKAFNIVSDEFGPGETLPVKLVIENDDSMKTKEYLTLTEKISSDLQSLDGIEKVRSATRPVGNILKDIYIKKQVGQVSTGIVKGNEGISTIKGGLEQASGSLKDSKPELDKAKKGISSLNEGTMKLESGATELQSSLEKLKNGIDQSSDGASSINIGVKEAKAKAIKLKTGVDQLQSGNKQLASSLGDLESHYAQIQEDLESAQQALVGLTASFQRLESSYPGITENRDYNTIKGVVHQTSDGLKNSSDVLNQLNGGLSQTQSGLNQANQSLEGVSNGLIAFSNGLSQIITGLSNLESGLNQISDGQDRVVNQMPQFVQGLDTISNGQSDLVNGFGNLGSQLGSLTDGLDESSKGLGKIGSGLTEAGDYLGKLSDETKLNRSGVYIPDELLSSDAYKQVFPVYFSPDGKVMTMDIVLKENPYSNKAISTIDSIHSQIKQSIKGTKLENAHIGIGGITSVNHDLKQVSDADYSRTVTFMLIGIGLILIILLRSIVMPVYILGSLLLTYFTAISITEFIFTRILDYPGVSWTVPFFGFVILMALGVDYSIFLMDRFNEVKGQKVELAMLLAMKNMGSVIMSAVVILAGTFAAMLPSGVLSLLQIATLVLSGLLLYAFMILPLFIPVMAKLFGEGNWWPFKRTE